MSRRAVEKEERGKGGKVEKLGTEGGGSREFVLALQKTTLRV